MGTIAKLSFQKSLNALLAKKTNDPLDSTAFVLGMVTILKQYHSDCTEQFIALLAQYVRSVIATNTSNTKVTELSADVINVLCFLEDFVLYGELSHKSVEAHVPTYIFENYKHQTAQ